MHLARRNAAPCVSFAGGFGSMLQTQRQVGLELGFRGRRRGELLGSMERGHEGGNVDERRAVSG